MVGGVKESKQRMNTKLLNLMAGSILATSSLLPLAYVHAEDQPYPMPTENTPYDSNPSADGSPTSKVLIYGKDKNKKDVPDRMVRITNNSEQTIYPIMRDPNSATTVKDGTDGLYDPFDVVNKEYRGYIGYKKGDTYYFGLPPGKSILVKIPLVFWNGARMGLGTDGKFLVVGRGDDGKGDALQNPLRYRNDSVRTIAPSESDDKDPELVENGVVMWYRADKAEAPNDDTEDQLVEWSIRDNGYLKSISDKVPDTELVQLINYDVSNVDNLYLPVAMQVVDAWVEPQKTDDKGGTLVNPNRNGGWSAGSLPKPNGWTGSIDKIKDLQDEIRKFTATPNEYLGEYFGKEKYGWPYYNMPGLDKNPNLPIKIPSGANIFAQSPIKAVQSSYKDGKNWQNDKYMLSSGGTEAISFSIGASGEDVKSGYVLKLTPDATTKESEKAKMAFVKEDFVVTTDKVPNPLSKDTRVQSVSGAEVTLKSPIVGSTKDAVFTFTRPSKDYAADAMIRLWFSWAEYYRKYWKKNNANAPTAPIQITGSMDLCSATIEFDKKQDGLVPGMAVSGPGLDEATTEDGVHRGKAVILEVAGDGKSVIVSQVAKFKKDNEKYTFAPPEELIWTPKAGQPGYPLFHNDFDFPESKKEAARDPYLFAQKVYLIMASMNQIGEPNNNSTCKFMQDVVGANMGYIFDPPAKASDDGKMVTSMIRDMIKSVLRGVTDFTEFPDVVDSDNKHLVWYPNPATPTGGKRFNVFNLDPFVWFVHVKLGFSGYGFSVDDDTADIGAGGATRLQISVAGPKGLQNLNEWSIQAPFGPLKDVKGLTYSGPDDTVFAPGTIKEITRTSDGNVKITTVGASNMRDGDRVFLDQVPSMPAINEKIFKVRHAKKESFEIVDETTDVAVPFSGQYTTQKTGRFGPPKQPYIDTGSDLTKVFHLVQDDDALRTFQGTLVTVNVPGQGAISQNKDGVKFRIQRKGDTKEGRLILNTPLTNKDGTPLPAGTNYTFDFTGSSSKEKKK